MSRLKGSKDLKKRKTRVDKKFKTRKKKGKMIPYYSKRKKSDPVKLWTWSCEPMPYKSIQRIPPRLRPTARKFIYKQGIRIDVMPKDISTKEKVEQLLLDVEKREGDFLLMMFCHRKNKYRVSPVKVCRVVIRESKDGLVAQMVENFRLKRYWFWEKNQR